MKNQGNMTRTKKQNRSPVTNLKAMEKYELPDKEFKVIILKKLSELKVNTDRQLNQIRETIHKQMRISKEIETTTATTKTNRILGLS